MLPVWLPVQAGHQVVPAFAGTSRYPVLSKRSDRRPPLQHHAATTLKQECLLTRGSAVQIHTHTHQLAEADSLNCSPVQGTGRAGSRSPSCGTSCCSTPGCTHGCWRPMRRCGWRGCTSWCRRCAALTAPSSASRSWRSSGAEANEFLRQACLCTSLQRFQFAPGRIVGLCVCKLV